MPKAKRCKYTEGRRRCTFNAVGNGDLCQAHRVALAEAMRRKSPIEVLGQTVVDFLSGAPVNGEATIGAIRDIAGQWSGNVGADYRPDVTPGESESSVHRRGQPGTTPPWWWAAAEQAQQRSRAARQPPPPPPEDEQIRKIRWARTVLGIEPDETLTPELIRKRHRRLFKTNHPDPGGAVHKPADVKRATQKMADINVARDILIASL